ncbi:hypothetical protein Tco_1293820 [Tanacetum coccineum]
MARQFKKMEAEEEENRLAQEEATNEALIKNFDDIKAKIEADRILAEKLQKKHEKRANHNRRKSKVSFMIQLLLR